ncbi:MAG: hypothetical protein ACC608_05025 [Anaerofustis sp.]
MNQTHAAEQKWYRLDNAAKIYPAVLSENDSCVFRVAANLYSDVKPAVLQQAVADLKPRFPMMYVRLRSGLFWNYYESNEKVPLVKPESCLMNQTIHPHKNNGYDFTIFYYANRISLEVFHSLCDGTGAMEFLKAVLFRYFELLGISSDASGKALTVYEHPSIGELEDSFAQNYQSGKKRNRTKVTNAYQIRGTRFSTENGIGVINGKIDARRFAASAKEHGATVTQYLAALLTYAIWQSDGFAKTSKRPINICIPVNLRKYFNSHSLRNFSLIFHTSTQCGGKKLTFDDILETIKQDFREELTLDKLQEMLNANVSIEKTLAPFPLFLKKIGIRIGTSLLGDKIKTCTISNLGKIDLPAELNDKIKDFDFCLPVGNGSTHSVSVATHNNRMTVSFARRIYETEVERVFFSLISELGIPVEIQSNLIEQYA